MRCLVTFVRQFSSYTHISVPHRRSTCCVLAPVQNDVRWCGCAPPQSVECGARTPLASSPHPTQPPTSTAHPHITGYGLRSTHVVFERCVSPNPGTVHRRFITPPRRPCMYLRCRTDGVQRHGAPPVACLHLRGPSRVGIPAASLGTEADSAVLPCPCASIRYDFPNPHQCTWNSQAARRRTPLRSLRSSSLGSNEFCVDACTCEQPD